MNYLTIDNLGTPRINTDANGLVTARHDYHPFGEEISTGQRSVHPEYTGDGIRKNSPAMKGTRKPTSILLKLECMDTPTGGLRLQILRL